MGVEGDSVLPAMWQTGGWIGYSGGILVRY